MLGTGAAITGATLASSPAFGSSGAPTVPSPSSWLADTVLYQVYPQSFADTNGDGIGDLNGIIEHLDYLRWLGVGAIWVNPVFPSPFTDAGYDIADYKSVHPRYGDEQDVVRLVAAARTRGIRVLFDLVAGHTSDQHPWFVHSLHDDTDDRYIWATPDQLPEDGTLPAEFVASPGPRAGAFRKNYYATQPAINYGYARLDPAEPWRESVTAEGPRRNRAAMRDVLGHWLRLGVSGFRCDMAATLVKDDPGWVETGKLWGELRSWMRRHYPEAVLISEWGDPATSVPAGFDADFYLPVNGPGDGAPWKSLWRDEPYFGAAGTGTAKTFIEAWTTANKAIGDGHTMLPIANHDSATRLNDGVRTAEQLPVAFAFQLTWPTIPVLYYGEEIGMRAVEGLPDVEGSAGRQRNRTPMQWNGGRNAGFSTADARELYIPLDPDSKRPTVEAQCDDRSSLLHFVRRLLALRKTHAELGSQAAVRVFDDGYPLTYLRGDRFLITVNPRREVATAAVPDRRLAGARAVEDSGVRVNGETITVPGFGYAILDLNG